MIRDGKSRLFFLLLAILLAACSPFSPLKAQSIGTPSLAVSPTPQSAIQLQPCQLGSATAQCGTLKVYENRAARSGRMIVLRVAVIKASSGQPAPDPIFYLAGGPGEAATEDAARGQQFPYSLSENHDLVFVDQRGTGGSNRVLVPTNPPDFTGLTSEEMDARAKAWVEEYLEEIDMDPRFYTTSAAMDDLDEVREALGYDKINLVGYSYGATAAQYYLRQHEEHVRTVFLYGGSLLDIPVFERWALNSQRALDKTIELCLADPTCQAGFPNLRAEFSEIMARLAAEPVTGVITNAQNSEPVNFNFTPDLFAAIIRTMLKDAKNSPQLPLLIHRAYQEGDFSKFTEFYANNGTEWWGDQMMERVIRCGEKWAAFDPDAVARLSEDSYLKGWDVSLSQNQAFACRYTPRGEMPEGMAPQTGSRAPVLVINSELDPIDPPENMAGAKELWPNSRSLVLPYHGHSLSDYEAIACLWSIQDQFIQNGSVEALDTGCLNSIQPPAFVVPVTQVQPTIPTSDSTTEDKPIFTTTIGDLTIEAVRWVDEVNGVMPGPDEKLLLISIRKPGQEKLDPNTFSLRDFDIALRDQSNGEVHVGGDDGSYAVCSMAGWVGENYEAFAMGFRIPKSATTIQLFWPGNEPIDLEPTN